jgi:hypothetical protein
MKVNKAQLQKALEIVKPGLASKEQIEQSTSFAFIKGRVVTYNDEISVSHPVKGLELEGAILAENLYKFLTKIKKEEIELELKDNEIILTSEKAKAGLLLQKEIKLPLEEGVTEKGEWYDLPEHFLTDLAFVMTICGKDLSRPILTACHINKAGFIEGSDGYRIARCELGEKLPVDTFLLPAKSAVEVVKMKPIQMAEGKGWIHFKTPARTIIHCRILLGDRYPTTGSWFNEDGILVRLPKITNEILARAQVFAKRDHLLDESITLSFEKGLFCMTSQSDTGWFKEEADMRFTSTPVKIDVTPYLLKSILEETSTFKYTEDKLTFKGERWYYVTTLRHPKK